MNDFTPKYLMVYDAVKNDIETGKLLPGTFLPPEKKLMEMYACSRTTVRKAMQRLEDDSYVEIRQGRGTRVSLKDAKDTSFGLQKSHLFKEVSIGSKFLVDNPKTQSQSAVIDTVQASAHVAEVLNIAENGDVYRLQRVKLVNGSVFGYVVSFIPVAYCPDLEKYNGQITNLYSALKKYYGITITVGEEQISAMNAGFVESKILDVKVGSPLLFTSRVADGENNTPVEYSESIFNPSLYNMIVSMESLMDDSEE